MKDKIKKWLEKQGYPLEFQVANELRQNGFSIIQSDYFVDPDTGENREIDILGFKQVRVKKTLVRISLLIECKSGKEKPWLLLSTLKSGLSDVDRIMQTPRTKYGTVLLNGIATTEHYKNYKLFSTGDKSSFGVTECFSNGKDIPYKALMSVAKATMSKIQEESGLKEMEFCDIIFPFVIIQAPLFESFYSDKLEINQVKSGTLVWRNKLIDQYHTIIKIQTFEAFKQNLIKYTDEIDNILLDAEQRIIPGRQNELDELRPGPKIY